MASSNSILTRIQDHVGDDITTITGYKDLICSGFNYIADIIPNDSELWRHSIMTPVASLADSSKHKVIVVTRSDSSDSVERVATEVPLDYLKRGEDETSIYYNAGNYKNPIFSYLPNGTFVGRPSGGTFSIYAYTYLTSEDVTNVTDVTNFTTIKFPEEAGYLAILKSAANIIQALISNAVQDEEDQELLGLLNGQSQSLGTLIQGEMTRLNLPHNLVGDGNDIE